MKLIRQVAVALVVGTVIVTTAGGFEAQLISLRPFAEPIFESIYGWSGWLLLPLLVAGLMKCAQVLAILANAHQHGHLREAHNITTVCYLFCLAAWLTWIVGQWLLSGGHWAGDGRPVCGHGQLALLIASESINFKNELVAFVALVSIAVVPQWANYVVAGFFGAAGKTWFTAWCLNLVFWFGLKCLAVAGGVSLGWVVVATSEHWPRAYDRTPLQLLGAAFTQLFLAVLLATLAGPLAEGVASWLRNKAAPLVQRMRPWHNLLTRHVRSRQDASR